MLIDNERNTGKSKSQKRKIERTSKFDSTKTKRRVKEIEQNPAFTQPNTSLSQSDVERGMESEQLYSHHLENKIILMNFLCFEF